MTFFPKTIVAEKQEKSQFRLFFLKTALRPFERPQGPQAQGPE